MPTISAWELTPLGQEVCFEIWFKVMAGKCQYDKDFAINKIDKMVDKLDGGWEANFKSVSCDMVNKYHKGVCRNFACCVANELSSWKIKNYFIIFGQEHVANLYISPVNGKIMVADLTYEIRYKKDQGYKPELAVFSAIPLKKYIQLFYKETNFENIYVLNTESEHVRTLREYLSSAE